MSGGERLAIGHVCPPLRLHLISGLPTGTVRSGFEQVAKRMPLLPPDGLLDAVGGESDPIGILLPPFVEPSLVVESWEECAFLPHHFGRPAYVAGVPTLVDLDPDRLCADPEACLLDDEAVSTASPRPCH